MLKKHKKRVSYEPWEQFRKQFKDNYPSKSKWEDLKIMTDTEKKLQTLYKLMEELEKDGRTEEANTLKWAIFTLENSRQA